MRVALDFASHWQLRGGVWRYGLGLAGGLARLLPPGHVTVPCFDRLPADRLAEVRATGAAVRTGWRTRLDFLDSLAGYRGKWVPWHRVVPAVYRPAVRRAAQSAAVGRCDVYHSLFNSRGGVRRRGTVVTIHDLIPLLFPADSGLPPDRFRVTLAAAVRVADRIIVPAAAVRADLVEHVGVPPDKVRVVYHGIAPAFAPPPPDVTRAVAARHGLEPGRYFLYVGMLERRKNIERLVEAYLAAVPAAAGCPLVLVGAVVHDMPAVRKAVAAGDGRVRLGGYVADADLPGLYAGAVALAHVSLAEGFGFTPLEAMACGTPVVVASTTATGEVAGPGGLAVDPTDTAAIGRALRTLHADPAARRALAEAGRRRAAEFTWEASARNTLAVYEEVRADRGGREAGA